ncbi:MAG TPA: phosphate-starvation-inducible PsiE family protein [Smithella sp.]|nr:phosphate-starvation-inducible PsiE family protein [Smithella sp.]
MERLTKKDIFMASERLKMHLDKATGLLKQTERVILVLVAIVMSALALFLLITSVYSFCTISTSGHIQENAIEFLNSILLVIMISEIVHTTILDRELDAEPFLIVGIIAAIRRILVVTAKSSELEVASPEAFRNMLFELGLLAVTILLIAVAFYILRRNNQKS